jgi:hypothetical protein
MGEIGIHLENELIMVEDSPFKAMDIRRSQSQLALPLFQEELAGIFLLELPDNIRRPVRENYHRSPAHDTLSQLKNGFQDLDNILLFVVRRYDDDLFQMAIICFEDKIQKLQLLAPSPAFSPFF